MLSSREKLEIFALFSLGLYGSTAEVIIAFLLNILKNNHRLSIFKALCSQLSFFFSQGGDRFLLTFMDFFFTHVRA